MNDMPQKGILTGSILIAVALIGYFASGMASWTALIPAIAGLPILLCSLVARKDHLLKHGMHGAAVFALLGFLAPLGRLIPTAIKGEFVFNLATAIMLAMLVICGFFLFLCIQSFKAARRAKQG
ncbi:hypothetical protein [Roseibacillus ishigakijimensis]|uniref:Uncharacterized protein n=1 Tax=Roseibacillus ishigakijimensis TaxID=454146 RepID=A0A934RSU6_9BACT|nr:hypothetical protein [Roseibacillus ishigakijimensis]MBK1833871.1 hypothetical protein [Roseibacillus ishigakijimensis]